MKPQQPPLFVAWLGAALFALVFGVGPAVAFFPQRLADAPLGGALLEDWLKRVDAAEATDACAVARLLEPHLDMVGHEARTNVVRRWRTHPKSFELRAWSAWLDGAEDGHVRSWLVCSTPAGQPPSGVVRVGRPCFSGAQERFWQRVEADPHTGLVWLDDFVVATTAERDERLHLVSEQGLPTDAESIRFGAAAGEVDFAVVAHESGLEEDRYMVLQHTRSTELTHAAYDQVVVPLVPMAGERGSRTVLVQLQPSRHESTRFRLRFVSNAGATSPTTSISAAALIPDLAALATARTPPPHPCALPRSPLLQAAFGRAIGMPDGTSLVEDLLLQLDGSRSGLADLQLVLPTVRRPSARQAITSYFLLRAVDSVRPLAALVHAGVALGRAEVHRAELILADQPPAPPNPTPTPMLELSDFVRASLDLAGGRPDAVLGRLAPRCQVPATCPTATAGLLMKAFLATGRDREARALFLAHHALNRSHPALQALAQRLPPDSEHLSTDADQARERALASPSRIRLRLENARWQARLTSREQAARQLVALVGDDALRGGLLVLNSNTRNELAELLLEFGQVPTAADVIAGTLARDPADPFARRLDERVRLARGQGRDDLPDIMSKNAPRELLTTPEGQPDLNRLRALPTLARPGAFEILDEQSYIHVANDGSATRLSRRVLRAGPASDGRREPWQWRFDPSRADVRILKATIHGQSSATNTARPLRGISTENRRNDATLLYFDEREVVIPTDAVEPGELVELVWLVEPVGHHFPGYFELIETIQLQIPRHAWRLTIDAPRALPLRHHLVTPAVGAPPAPEVVFNTTQVGLLNRFEARAGPARPIPNEPFAPPLQEVAAVLQVSTIADHATLGRFWADLVSPQAVITPAMKRVVAQAVARSRTRTGAVDEARLARDLSGLVAEHIRYVGLEFGIHGYKPYRTDDVWARRFGDCKDQSLVLVTLLREAGIAADPVLVRTRRLGRLVRGNAQPLPMLAAFDHAVVHIRSRNHFVDPTALHHGYDTLHPDNQGADALIVPLRGDTEPTLVSLPRDPPSRNGVRGDFGVLLNPDGSAHITGRIRFVGIQAGAWRSRLADESRREQNVQAMVEGRFPGLELQLFSVDGLDSDAAGLKLLFEGRVAHLAGINGDQLRIGTPLPLGGQRSRLGEPSRRALPFAIGTPGTGSFEVQWTLPPGFTTVALPPPFEERIGAAHGSIAWSTDAGRGNGARTQVSGRVELTFDADTVTPAELPELAAFLERFDTAVARELAMVRVERGADATTTSRRGEVP